MEQAGGTLDGLSPMRREFSLRSGHARARSDTDPPPPAMLGVQTAVYDLGGVRGGGGARPYAGPEAGSSFRSLPQGFPVKSEPFANERRSEALVIDVLKLFC